MWPWEWLKETDVKEELPGRKIQELRELQLGLPGEPSRRGTTFRKREDYNILLTTEDRKWS